MTARLHRTPLRVAAGLLATLVSASACHLNLSLDAEAKDTWTRDYPLAAGGTLEIRNTSGRIEVEAADVEGISLVAERVVKAGTDEAAQQALAALEISETVSADRVITPWSFPLYPQIHHTEENLRSRYRISDWHHRSSKIRSRMWCAQCRFRTNSGFQLKSSVENRTCLRTR
jgi:hypothetical protein